MPRAALYEIMVLSLCNALVGMFVVLAGPILVDVEALPLGMASWCAAMSLVWWRTAVMNRRLTWNGVLVRAVAAGLLGHPLFFLAVGTFYLPWKDPFWEAFQAGLIAPWLFSQYSFILYGGPTLYGALFLALLLGWWRRCSGLGACVPCQAVEAPRPVF